MLASKGVRAVVLIPGDRPKAMSDTEGNSAFLDH